MHRRDNPQRNSYETGQKCTQDCKLQRDGEAVFDLVDDRVTVHIGNAKVEFCDDAFDIVVKLDEERVVQTHFLPHFLHGLFGCHVAEHSPDGVCGRQAQDGKDDEHHAQYHRQQHQKALSYEFSHMPYPFLLCEMRREPEPSPHGALRQVLICKGNAGEVRALRGQNDEVGDVLVDRVAGKADIQADRHALVGEQLL